MHNIWSWMWKYFQEVYNSLFQRSLGQSYSLQFAIVIPEEECILNTSSSTQNGNIIGPYWLFIEYMSLRAKTSMSSGQE